MQCKRSRSEFYYNQRTIKLVLNENIYLVNEKKYVSQSDMLQIIKIFYFIEINLLTLHTAL